MGEDPNREGLRDTPDRWARWWCEFIDYDPGNLSTNFATVAVDELVVVRGVEVWSICEHHLLPFSATVAVGYLTGERILGLSKFARIAHRHAHRLQLQERLVHDIAGDLCRLTGSEDVAVVATGHHLCMTIRGVRSPASMVTSVMRGRFRAEPELRSEFLSLAEER